MPTTVSLIDRTSIVMPSPPGWVQAGAIADYDFVNQRYWQQGNPSGGIVYSGGVPTFTANGLAVTGGFTGAVAPSLVSFAGTLFVQTYACAAYGSTSCLLGRITTLGFLDGSDTVTNIANGSPQAILTPITLGSGNLRTGLCKRVVGFDGGGMSGAANGGTVATNSTTMATLAYGLAILQPTFVIINGSVQRVTLWPSRLPDATIKTLST